MWLIKICIGLPGEVPICISLPGEVSHIFPPVEDASGKLEYVQDFQGRSYYVSHFHGNGPYGVYFLILPWGCIHLIGVEGSPRGKLNTYPTSRGGLCICACAIHACT